MDKSFQLGIGLLILLGIGIRLWVMDHGLPYFFYSDEGIFTYQALNMGGQGFNAHYLVHPTLFLYLLLFLDGLFILGGMLTGRFHQPSDAWQLYLTDPTPFYLMGRYASAAFGILTILLTYLIGKRVFSKEVGLIGALFLTFSLLHVQWSQLGYNDVPLTFFTILAFLFAFQALRKGRYRDFIFSGFTVGLATSTKYQGLVALLWGPLASFLSALKNGANWVRGLWGEKNILFFLFFVLGFTLGTPFWLLELQRFKNSFLWHWANLHIAGAGQLGYEGDWNWGYYLTTVLPYGLGLPVTLSGVLGLILLASRFKKNENLFFLSFPIIFFFLMGMPRIRVAKYLLPIFPFFCLAAAFFLATVSAWITQKNSRKAGTVFFLASFLLVAPNLLDAFRYAYLRMFPDTRELAYRWIQERIPPKSKILESSYMQLSDTNSEYVINRFDPTLLSQVVKNRSSLKSLQRYREEGFDYLILDEWHRGMALIEASRQPNRRETAERYKNFLKELKQSATLLTTFSPYREDHVPFDMENVELPSRSLGKMKSTGPTIWIYRL